MSWKAYFEAEGNQEETFGFSSKAPSALIHFRFKRKQSCFALDMAIVHTAMPKMMTENWAIGKRSQEWSNLKMMLFEMLFSSVDRENDAISKRWRHQNRHDQAPDHSTVSIQNGGQTLPWGFNFAPISWANTMYIEMRMHRVHLSMRTEGIKAFSKRIWCCRVDGWKRWVWTQIWKRSKTAPFSFENGLVWTGPKNTPPQIPAMLNFGKRLLIAWSRTSNSERSSAGSKINFPLTYKLTLKGLKNSWYLLTKLPISTER